MGEDLLESETEVSEIDSCNGGFIYSDWILIELFIFNIFYSSINELGSGFWGLNINRLKVK